MTTKNIPVNDFPASRRLDAEVAKLLGWTDVVRMESGDGYKGTSPGGPPYVIPGYSRDIAAAWKLVERWPADTFTVQRCDDNTLSLQGWDKSHRWQAGSSWHPNGQVQKEYLTKGSTAPLAITRAFLKANGVTQIEVEDAIQDQERTANTSQTGSDETSQDD